MKLKKQQVSFLQTGGKKLLGLFIFLSFGLVLHAQTSGSITVGGDINTFYPVSWSDGNWDANRNTHLTIGRSRVHLDTQWRGAFVAEFTYHISNRGHGASFIDGHISTSSVASAVYTSFIAGWRDASGGNNDKRIIIWLRGGGTTYSYFSETDVSPQVHDGVQYTLPYRSGTGDVVLDVKTVEDAYVHSTGLNLSLPINLYGTAGNYMEGNLGIGKRNPTEKLEVNGTIRAKEIKVEASPWPDYVFAESYDLPSLKETENFIKMNKHLPDMPSAQDVEANGVALGEMNRLLLQKVEELTLHLIEKEKRMEKLEMEVNKLKEVKQKQ